MTTANINTAMLTWARERSGIAVSDFARKCGVDEARLQEWETGQRAMTFKQAMTFAAKAHIPFGYLFLSSPPEDTLPIPDLRTLGSSGVNRPSAELLDLIKLMLERQSWYRDYLRQHFVDRNPVVGRFSTQDTPGAIVDDMRQQLDLAPHPERGNWDDYYRDLVARIESLNILVMRQSNLGHYTRPLRVEEFRGFALVDDYAPLVFVNHADAPGARLFTLVHELCHIWIGQSGVSDASTQAQRGEEVLCNAVAAEFLVPAKEFTSLWRPDLRDWRDNLPVLEAHFHVSTWALARRALTLGFIDQPSYATYVNALMEAHRKREKSGPVPYYRTQKAQISTPFSKAVVTEALSGQMMLREAGWLLGGMKPNKIPRFAREIGV